MPNPSKTKANLGAAWMTDNDIRAALAKIHHNRNQHDNMVRKAHSDLTRRRQQLESSLDGINKRDRDSMVTKALAGHRNELARQSKDARLALTRELSALADRIKSAEAHYRSPMQMLMRDTLGDERRSRIQSQIEHSGPVELASLAELAAATRDKELAAALCGRVHGMKRDERPFNAGELADVMFGEQHRELSQALVEAERRVLEALQADQDFETGKGSPHRALQIAMLKKREAEIGAYGDPAPDDEEDADDAPAATATGEDRIVAGLKARRAPASEPTE
ncbi:hypothetical protein [Pseudoblastomonas halimionae]|uniref:Uncharacterized protein n=1 Tax=Alteriqipengyuania halimionae TaxID=1926630 RepID=A0A6I4U3X4_9SPHN|nr:hypothetical protein [Alteriqipengyuania halimionae]MXP09615.1 hypothetical protein [Alteriqipengyuania halimionae]